jgi:galactonate dehydratase
LAVKITSVEVFDVRVSWRRGWNPVIIRVKTDEGLSGLGEAGVAVGGGHNSYAAVVKDLAEMHLIGADPLNSEKIWETMLRRTWLAQGGGPIIYAGMSAIDHALWDIRGKAVGAPIYKLLGGRTNETIRAYASQIHFGWPAYQKPAVSPEELAEAAQRAVAEGFDAVKIDPITFDEEGRMNAWDMTKRISASRLGLIVRRMESVRAAVGPNVDIILETHANPELTPAIQIGRALEHLGLMYYEEPVNSNSVETMARVTRNVRIPLAAGEHIYTRWGYRDYFEKQVLEVIQPDLCLSGGIGEGKKICDMAHAYDLSVQCHCCGSPVSLAAALHVETAIPNFIIHEYVSSSGFPENRDLVTPDLQVTNGHFTVLEEPGLGIELNEKVMSRHLVFTIS